jgi:hypothetical protein
MILRKIQKYFIINTNFYVLLFFAILSMTQVLFKPWPMNHEGDSFFIRTKVYASHLRSFDLLPIWSMSDNLQYGGPFPLFYHKFFYLTSGTVQLFAPSDRITIVITVLIFLTLGAYFLHKLILDLTDSNFISIFCGLLLIFNNYTFTNWFIRGAMAEFSLAMLFPLILFLIYHFFKTDRYSFTLGVVLGLSFLSHSSVSFYILITFLPFLAYSTLFLKKFKQALQVLFGFTLVSGPYIILMIYFGQYINLKNILIHKPQDYFRPPSLYFWDPEYIFGLTWDDYTVVLDKIIVLFIFMVFLILIYNLNQNLKQTLFSFKNIFFLYLFFSVLFFIFLQLNISTFFYLYFPGAEYLQFPWRLLSLLVPILIIYIGLFLKQLIKFRLTKPLLIILFAIHLFSSPNFKTISYPRLDYKAVDLNETTNWISEGTGAYLPSTTLFPTLNGYKYFENFKFRNCEIKNGTYVNGDLRRNFSYSCRESENVTFPLLHSNFYRVLIKSNSQSAFEKTQFGLGSNGLITIDLPKGDGELIFIGPTLISSLLKILGNF